MKKLFLVGALALSTVFGANAQDLEGKWFVGGQLSFGSSEDKKADEKKDDFAILPTIGTFISSDVAVGAKVGFENNKTKVAGEQTSKTDKFVIAPFARKYWNISGGLNFFGEASLPVSFGTEQGAKGGVKTNSSEFGLAVAPGFDYIINDCFSIETSFQIFDVTYKSSKPKGGKSSSDFGAGFNRENNTVGKLSIGAKFLF